MPPSEVELYRAAFRARGAAGAAREHPLASTPGIEAWQPGADDRSVRALVADDDGEAGLAELVAADAHGVISVLHRAPRSLAHLRAAPGWQADPATAMVRPSLEGLPEAGLPDALELAPVHRRDGDPPGVGLPDAVRVARDAAGDGAFAPQPLADYLTGLPASTRLFAAVDGHGTVVATAGVGRYGDFALVMFVNTIHAWRGRGVAATMTTRALRAAREGGAVRASLDSSAPAVSLYRRLGFVSAGAVTRFRRGPSI